MPGRSSERQPILRMTPYAVEVRYDEGFESIIDA